MEKAVAIVSGGIDSTVALHWARKRSGLEVVKVIIFDYGQRHLREINYAVHQCDLLSVSHKIVYIPWMKYLTISALTNPRVDVPPIQEVLGHPQPVTYVPFRNLLFLTIACQFAEDFEADRVVFGAQLHDLYGYWDATPEFVERVNSILQLNRQRRIEVLAPLSKNSKGDNIRLGTELGVDFRDTYSCYEGHTYHCGKCATCAERKKGFVDAGIDDPTTYITLPETV